MNSTWGVITNGPENYREDSYCVWLIEGMLINFFQSNLLKFYQTLFLLFIIQLNIQGST